MRVGVLLLSESSLVRTLPPTREEKLVGVHVEDDLAWLQYEHARQFEADTFALEEVGLYLDKYIGKGGAIHNKVFLRILVRNITTSHYV